MGQNVLLVASLQGSLLECPLGRKLRDGFLHLANHLHQLDIFVHLVHQNFRAGRILPGERGHLLQGLLGGLWELGLGCELALKLQKLLGRRRGLALGGRGFLLLGGRHLLGAFASLGDGLHRERLSGNHLRDERLGDLFFLGNGVIWVPGPFLPLVVLEDLGRGVRDGVYRYDLDPPVAVLVLDG